MVLAEPLLNARSAFNNMLASIAKLVVLVSRRGNLASIFWMGECIVDIVNAVSDANFGTELTGVKLAVNVIDPVVVMGRVVGHGVIHAAENLHVQAGGYMKGEGGPTGPLILEADDSKVAAGALVAGRRADAVEGVAGAGDPGLGEENHVVVGHEKVVASVVVCILCQHIPNGVDSAVQTVQRGEHKLHCIGLEAGVVQNAVGLGLEYRAQGGRAQHGIIGIMTVVYGESKVCALAIGDSGCKGSQKGA